MDRRPRAVGRGRRQAETIRSRSCESRVSFFEQHEAHDFAQLGPGRDTAALAGTDRRLKSVTEPALPPLLLHRTSFTSTACSVNHAPNHNERPGSIATSACSIPTAMSSVTPKERYRDPCRAPGPAITPNSGSPRSRAARSASCHARSASRRRSWCGGVRRLRVLDLDLDLVVGSVRYTPPRMIEVVDRTRGRISNGVT